MSKEFHHVGVTVSNMDDALRFYRDSLGLEVTDRFSLSDDSFGTFVGVEGGEATIVFLDAMNCAIELLEYTHPPGGDANREVESNDIGATHFCLTVADIGSAYDDLATDYEFVSAPQTLSNGAQVANVYDPDNNVVQLIEE